ncbi:hypothetical protein PTSG_13269 [Salpingoeca rosetta]|uniref:ubiquitinyl hydrolase 1 n=1 Tax=Salpingoeca rosetta (strain ATCC 50818 / BSB-021) TaxID=946362 RepID=F2UQ46_SALR5|nr:uncharacterized protein PTSG_13269 [Salpingoeca rosetta]EGD79714.1 hypothetical protein PTSG_13269 [Salpingoeca rosetta]|eukprot:XP_004988664.1 hypothetical protein PTSG_13269 [Salpingoeca rosetta]
MDLYFETQRRQQCALHATNNFLQRKAYTRAGFDRICKTVLPAIRGSFFNPYKSPIPGIGNYDASVIVAALNEQGFDMEQHDLRKPLGGDACAWPVVGAIVNMPETGIGSRLARWSGVGDGRHFFCLRRRDFEQDGDGTWVLLDSKLASPQVVGGAGDTRARLQGYLDRHASVYLVKMRRQRGVAPAGDGDHHGDAQAAETRAQQGAGQKPGEQQNGEEERQEDQHKKQDDQQHEQPQHEQ